jgi:hypothetical protein
VGGVLGSLEIGGAKVLDEQLLTEVVVWTWVVFVLWGTPPDRARRAIGGVV